MSRKLPKVIATVALSAGLVFGAALPASAHVTVSGPTTAVEGSFPTLTFRVPNERVDSKTAKLQIILPTEVASKLSNVLAKPHPGWNHRIEKAGSGGKIGEGVVSITWTAKDSSKQIKAGDFDEFQILGGRIPAVDQIFFTAVQTYSDGDVVRWDERPTAEVPHPPHMAPALKVVPASGGHAATATNASLPLGTTGKTETASEDSTPILRSGEMAASAATLVGVGGLTLILRRRNRAAAE